MPNGDGQRWEHEKEHIIQPIENEGWEFLLGDDRPNWVENNVPDSMYKKVGFEYEYRHYHGDTFVYKVTSTVHGNGVHIFRKLKSDYHETTSEEGTCPNCQSYVRRYEDDEYLTCHRCGWQYKPLKERIKNLF